MTIQWEPHVQTSRLYLRPLSNEDFEAMYKVRDREEVRKHLSTIPGQPTLDETKEWLKTRSWPTKFNFAILVVDDTKPRSSWPVIGAVGCARLPDEVGYAIHLDYQGKGYATEALKAFVTLYWQFAPSAAGAKANDDPWSSIDGPRPSIDPSDQIFGRTDTNNIPSKRILEKCGFGYLGIKYYEKVYPGDSDSVEEYVLRRPAQRAP